MEMFFRKLGAGPPLIIVHGLYGSSDNWLTIGRGLSVDYEVCMVDLRNHGNSPHADRHTYPLMKLDLLEFMDRHDIEKPILIGHSMGGKVVMFFAADFPERVASLVVIDMSPKSYHSLTEISTQAIDHMNILNGMQNMDFSKVHSREDAGDQMSEFIRSSRIRNFLLKNIKRNPDGTYGWKINVPVLVRELPSILEGMDQKKAGITGFPVLFVKGENSPYIQDQDLPLIRSLFPQAEFVTIPGAGHWLHAEKPELLVKTLRYFLKREA
jgi:pimeloyl-ACP methyl ester carboxylesterase